MIGDRRIETVSQVQSRSVLRWWLAVLVGTIFSLPFSWLLSYAASLPFFIGLFFFALFGLIIGAVTFRIARRGRPYGIAPLVMGTTIIVLVCWWASIVNESRDFPLDMAVQAANRTRDLGDRTRDEFHQAVATDIRRYLDERYAPGGTIGYLRWAVKDGELPKGSIAEVDRALRPVQRGWLWCVRAVLSVALLAFGVASVTFPLRLVAEKTFRVTDE